MKSVLKKKPVRRDDNHAFLSGKGNQLSITGPGLVELLQAVLDKGALFRFQAKGSSMSPFIRDCDIITVSSTADRPCVGDIVAFIRPGTQQVVIHRIIGKTGPCFSIRGDSLHETDGLIAEKYIMGRVIKIERNGKPVFFGLGREKALIAFLSRNGLFDRYVHPTWRFIKPIMGKFVA